MQIFLRYEVTVSLVTLGERIHIGEEMMGTGFYSQDKCEVAVPLVTRQLYVMLA